MYVGCSAKHNNFVELHLRENYKADWSPSAVEKALKNSISPARHDNVAEVDEASTSVLHVATTQEPKVPPMLKKVR